jgi:hypothetical protein
MSPLRRHKKARSWLHNCCGAITSTTAANPRAQSSRIGRPRNVRRRPSQAAAEERSPSRLEPFGPLAKFGIGKTLRARWLAAHGRGGTIKTRRSASKLAVKRSVVPDPLVAGKPAPRIALVNGEPEPPLVLEPLIKTERLRVASMSPPRPTRDAPLLPTSPAQTQPVASCAGETLRLENYAVRAIQGIARSPDEDLRLFATDGSPWPALPRLLANMAAVEIGPYRADAKLIDAAVEAVRSARSADAARD